MPGTSNLELRWDVFNVFNKVNFALPENVIGDAGRVSARSPTPSEARA
jgi:hypothetical protein